MAINEKLTERVRQALAGVTKVEEKKMFSGITFMVNGKMCISVGDDRLMCRVDPARHDELAAQPGATTMMMKGRPYKGYLYVNQDVIKTPKQLWYWVDLCLDFNTKAKAAKKKKK
jgi:TfoX/Sxy family transcriptional regulator of competence genes